MGTEPECGGCGLWKYWWWQGFFKECCRKHDAMYRRWNKAIFKDSSCALSLHQVDNIFLACMTGKAEGRFLRTSQAYFMYSMAHLYGLINWKGKR